MPTDYFNESCVAFLQSGISLPTTHYSSYSIQPSSLPHIIE
jgi:hypothetical protein